MDAFKFEGGRPTRDSALAVSPACARVLGSHAPRTRRQCCLSCLRAAFSLPPAGGRRHGDVPTLRAPSAPGALCHPRHHKLPRTRPASGLSKAGGNRACDGATAAAARHPGMAAARFRSCHECDAAEPPTPAGSHGGWLAGFCAATSARLSAEILPPGCGHACGDGRWRLGVVGCAAGNIPGAEPACGTFLPNGRTGSHAFHAGDTAEYESRQGGGDPGGA